MFEAVRGRYGELEVLTKMRRDKRLSEKGIAEEDQERLQRPAAKDGSSVE